MHKVKTIGDAYIVRRGAFDLKDDGPGRHAGRQHGPLQYIVSQKAFERGVDISVRIGVHTGMVIGGVIVRFHWDMWGNGVGVRCGSKLGSVAVSTSPTSNDLIEGHFSVAEHARRPEEGGEGGRAQHAYADGRRNGDIDKAAAALAETFDTCHLLYQGDRDQDGGLRSNMNITSRPIPFRRS